MGGVWFGFVSSVVSTTVRESATPGSKNNKQADAGSPLFLKPFSVRRVVVKLFVSRESVKVYLHTYMTCRTGMFGTPLYSSSRLNALNPMFETVHKRA